MKTTIDNNQRLFLLKRTGWNSQHYACNLADVVLCAKQFEKNQPYNVYELFNFKIKKLSVKTVITFLESNQLDATFFKPNKN